MAVFQRGGAKIYYEEWGSGFPILLLAPGGMRSAISYWENTPWNPIEQLSESYRMIAMDQRNAGRSTAPIHADDGWHTYTADQLGLMDHLGTDRFHVAGMCIGGPYCMGLIEAAPERVASAVLFQPIGRDNNHDAFYQMFDGWADDLKTSSHREVPEEVWTAFRSNMYDGEAFLFNVDRDFVAQCQTPLLVLKGNDLYHPASTSLAIRDLAPRVEFIEQWKDEAHVPAARKAMADFLARNSP